MGLDAICTKIQSGEIAPEKLAPIFSVLSETAEVFVHRQRGAEKNQIFVSTDGHREAVYGADGKLVTDGINDGTYNYFPRQSDPMRHFFYDMHPWIIWGFSAKDPTTIKERIFAYVSDLESGVAKVASSSGKAKIKPADLKTGEIEAYAIFLHIITEAQAEEFFTLLDGSQKLDDAGRVRLLRKLESGFQKVYSRLSSS